MNSRTDFGMLSACFIAVIASVLFLWHREAPAAESRDTMVLASFFGLGSDTKLPAIDFELPDLNGAVVRLSKFKGERTVLIYFWATWCPYCSSVRPEVTKLREKVGPSEMEILAIDVGGSDSIERVKRYQEGHPVSWPILYDGEGKVARAYKVQGIPLFILVNKEGIVVYRESDPPSDVRKYLQ
jgi:cytochrome c biogenesis protein CcmG, thiol:disulfide interchange protein DsbE